jgi:hypothetical protein
MNSWKIEGSLAGSLRDLRRRPWRLRMIARLRDGCWEDKAWRGRAGWEDGWQSSCRMLVELLDGWKSGGGFLW